MNSNFRKKEEKKKREGEKTQKLMCLLLKTLNFIIRPILSPLKSLSTIYIKNLYLY